MTQSLFSSDLDVFDDFAFSAPMFIIMDCQKSKSLYISYY